jgi:hypothetical protein
MTTDLACINEDTGELVAPDGPGAAELTIAALHGYADAKAKLDLVRIDKDARLAALEGGADPELAALTDREYQLAMVVANIEFALRDVFTPDVRLRLMRPISLDVGTVRVTWGKPAERWSQRVKPEAIMARDPELAKALGVECKVGEPPAPRITVRGEK